MHPSEPPFTGGCQCGAVRFRVSRLGGSAICHCRMCQKAFGGYFAALVTAHDLVWTRGRPAEFRSSNMGVRGFCAACGTPLTYQYDGVDSIEVAVPAFDHPEVAAPTRHVNPNDRHDFVMHLDRLPTRDAAASAAAEARHARIVSRQHPDHDTDAWPPMGGFPA